MIKKTLNHVAVYWIGGLVILVDQLAKHWVRTSLAVNESWNPLPWLAPYARILHIQNSGAAFGMFQSGGLIFTVVALVVSAVIIYYAARLPEGQWPLRIALGLQLGGALGNLVDRLVFGPVTDFFSIWVFPIFNVSDLGITSGIILLILLMWRDSRRRRPLADGPTAADPVDLPKST
jgi:signal peptidase II